MCVALSHPVCGSLLYDHRKLISHRVTNYDQSPHGRHLQIHKPFIYLRVVFFLLTCIIGLLVNEKKRTFLSSHIEFNQYFSLKNLKGKFLVKRNFEV